MAEPHAYVNPFVQCHPGNPNCVPMEGHCKACGEPRNDPQHHDGASDDG